MTENNQGNVEEKSGEGVDALSDTTRYYKAIGIEIVWLWHEDRLTNLQLRIHSPKTDSRTYTNI